ncbi:MAG: shikimate kinase [Bacteroidota bacterium]
MSLQKHLCLLGFMGSGKSTVGQSLAQRLGISWVDSDYWIEEKHGRSISDIVSEKGWPAFRAMEREFTFEMNERAPMVISCGGGFPLDHDNWQWISNNCTSIYLRVDKDVLLNRLINETSSRPLLKDMSRAELLQFIDEKLTERMPVYTKSDWIIDANGTVQETIQRIQELI